MSSYEPILSASAELVWTKLFIVGIKPLYICSYYRTPNSELEPLVELKNSLSPLLNGKSVPPHPVVTGDFNLPEITWTETGGRLISNPTYGAVLNNTFLNILDDFSLEQLVLSPTRGNHILDLILTSQPGLFTDVTIVPGMSDHEVVTFRFNATVKRLTKVKRKILLFHKANLEEMKAKLQRFEKEFTESNPSGPTVEENWTLFKQYIFATLNEFVARKYVRRNNDLAWILQ